MKLRTPRLANAIALVSTLAIASPALANTTITTFDNFTSDALYASWGSGTIVSGPTSYSVTATGYGSNYKYIGGFGINGLGNTTIELSLTLSGPLAADGQLGPIVELIDGDGTDVTFAWYGQNLGSLVLTKAIDSPSWTGAAGSVPGLDLSTLTHMHMQLDPGGFGTQGAYTVEWQNLSLTGVPEPSAFAMLALGAGGFFLARRRQR
jgi:hypothetical protein